MKQTLVLLLAFSCVGCASIQKRPALSASLMAVGAALLAGQSHQTPDGRMAIPVPPPCAKNPEACR